jgi:two-component system alkaline phosphatase synthesis response regulator PhoP
MFEDTGVVTMAKQTILVVEDEEDIRELVKYNLAKEGYQVLTVATGEEAVEKIRAHRPVLVVLDLMLPGLDGLDVCKILKGDSRTRPIPVIMLTAKGEESDIVAGLEVGADDYITKPFSRQVLIARIRAVLRRKQRAGVDTEESIAHGDLVIDPGRHDVRVKGRRVDLTATEFRLLHLLARKPGWVFTRQQIVDGVRGEDYAVTERAVDVQIVGVRRKLGPCAEYIETVRGVGYRFKE